MLAAPACFLLRRRNCLQSMQQSRGCEAGRLGLKGSRVSHLAGITRTCPNADKQQIAEALGEALQELADIFAALQNTAG